MKKLTSQQQLFVKEYLIDRNGKQAAIRAGYSEKTAEQYSYQLLQKPLVRDAVNKSVEKIARKVEISAEDVLQSIKEIRDDAKAADKYSEALKANELLGKHLKLFTDKVEVDGSLVVKVNRKRFDGTDG